ncbi:Fmo5 protein [Blastomyces gilchristii SLH14081]|uniref:Flavin-containing monooxygenase 1 n=1 Tax=Blastomyces gilchristii (strain SLH14081) TaxID=559298 RepID=A0A179UKQ4_BLAGS|nr:Fmo5 protein [Blastomyces gilchristii SLH14081]EQL30772.1 hypothetical protein BDFG_06803 [Blastomyces dermatitidis ATCC 26199]OAT07809.1 Fmo5 protein [Blastomyces gilchristii SLH14081]
MATKKVAIIGGGPSGLTTLKQCLAEGLDAVLFEVRGGIGGQWRYEDPNPETDDAISSIYEGVILNSTRDTSGFSDFPIDPAQYPEYFGHRRMLNYLEKYAEHFGLGKYMRLNTKVMSCNQRPDGRWTVVHQEKGADQVTSEYDAIFACSGHNSYPSTPVFEGMSSFQGDILHSHVYRRPARFDGKKVALIGFGSSAVDLACELVSVAKEVHMITRRGGWVIPRFVLGQPVELYDNRIAETLIPGGLSQWIQTKILNFAIGEHPEVIKPHHGIMEANPTVHSNLIEYIKVGKIHAHRAGVKQFNETSLVLTNDTVLDVDTVICCTGYNMDMPYLSKETYHVEGNPILKSPNTLDLYKLVVSPRFTNLFFIGYVELPGPLLPVAEAQARWASAILTGRVKLPSMDEMNRQVKEYQEELVRTMVVSDRHTATVRFLPYCDSLLADLDANPTIVRLLHKLFTSNPFRAFSLLKAVYFGVNSPAQYRLFGHGQKEELAAATLVRLNAGTGISVKEKELIDGQVRY